ncbi:hypothetical protein A3203_17960 [Burkholderia cenocepacia]|nr:hypothetical protein A3203_17960 [Burkholderia cenocepacia]
MQLPNVDNLIKDPTRNIVFNVCAYRELTRAEMVRAVQIFLRQNGRRKFKPGTVVKIISLIGASR